ncbi:MAG: RimK/LysX family protein [Acidobacteriota bacterium]
MRIQDPVPGPEGLPAIGWLERVALPLWGIPGIRAKSDTGARSSAIDVANLVELPGGRVSFEVILDRRTPEDHRVVEASIVRKARVRSSNGQAHDRLFVRTEMEIGSHRVEVELGLVRRPKLVCRMLLGRRALEGHFLVDAGRSYLISMRRPRRRRSR